MEETATKLDVAIAAVGLLLVNISLHLRPPGAPLGYSFSLGLFQNLTRVGKGMLLAGMIILYIACI